MIGRNISLHQKHACVLALAIAIAIPYGWRAAGSVALGGGMQIVNLRALERSVSAMLGLAASGRGAGIGALLQLRLLLLLAAVGVVLFATPVQPLAFGLGLTSLVPTVVWHGLTSAR